MMKKASLLNEKIIDNICEAVDSEILPIRKVGSRFKVEQGTLNMWISTGKKRLKTPAEYLTDHEKLCVALVERLNNIYERHEAALSSAIKHPEHAQTARLVSVLSPDWGTLERMTC